MKNNKDFWCSTEGLVLVSGWRRAGLEAADIAKRIGVSQRRLEDWRGENAQLDAAFRRGRDVADYLVEEAVFNKAVSGDLKACEFWLKSRMPEEWGAGGQKAQNEEGSQAYPKLAELLREPEGGDGE